MNLLLSLPPEVAKADINLPATCRGLQCYVDSDPVDRKLGSGGGTVWISNRFEASGIERHDRTIIIHAGGQSRRLPAYAATGKSLTPIPVLRWAVGETIDQTLLDLQLPLLTQIMESAPDGVDTLIASGDVLITNGGQLPAVPKADVVCFGLWAEPSSATNHGVFCLPRSEGSAVEQLDFMLQKPSVSRLAELRKTHYSLMDIGLWLLSRKAMEKLKQKSTNPDGVLRFYDLYSQFGCALGNNPSGPDPDLSDLTVAIVPLHRGTFYHFGTTRQLLSSTLSLQNVVADQRRILHETSKPNPALFVQNCIMDRRLTDANHNVWIENSHIAAGWRLSTENVVTGVPDNDWDINLPPGACLDMVPLSNGKLAVRPYGYDDSMRGAVGNPDTLYLGQSLAKWITEHDVELGCADTTDIQSAPLFAAVDTVEEAGLVARWMISEPTLDKGRNLWLESTRLSADELMAQADLQQLFTQRRSFLRRNLLQLADNRGSVFYQLDLVDTAEKFVTLGLDEPAKLPANAPVSRQLCNHMLRGRIQSLHGRSGKQDEDAAFKLMQQTILNGIDTSRTAPCLNVDPDQIVWGRSPVRIDLAGGWTDTPPYSLLYGGSVVNLAVELNGQPPLQVFIKPTTKRHILLRSIDLGAAETIDSYGDLTDFARVGSPFSLPKAALAIAGFAPGFSSNRFNTLAEQLDWFGSGLELTLLSALPAGSGMGTSSILAATVLGSLNDFCGLGWTTDEICERTLALEQLLTTGGGWQDQYGGVLQGIKLLQTQAGWVQTPSASWLPEGIFTDPQYVPCHLLYYTGITRTAKGILAEIVKRMFLNHGPTLSLLHSMKNHSLEMAEAIQRREFGRYGRLVGRSWLQNQLLDSGTCPAPVTAIVDCVSDLTLGLKLPGAGGGGYLYMVAKDPEAAAVIRQRLANLSGGRFTEMTISHKGLQISRS